ncbi:MAG: hypothetical protein GY950_23720, partial [bacterium]|nr:hypothetical protein [bacterium]
MRIKMKKISLPYVDGEKIPDNMVEKIFKQPPGVPTIFLRSNLVVGSRGVGKTTLFRYLKEIHQGTAVHLSLATELSSVTKQTGKGPLSDEFTYEQEKLIIGKTISLLAASITDRLYKKGLVPEVENLSRCLPEKYKLRTGKLNKEILSELKYKISAAPLDDFKAISESQTLPEYLAELGRLSQKISGTLLLLLDRADMILSPSIVPIIELLDQSNQYLACVAMRP